MRFKKLSTRQNFSNRMRSNLSRIGLGKQTLCCIFRSSLNPKWDYSEENEYSTFNDSGDLITLIKSSFNKEDYLATGHDNGDLIVWGIEKDTCFAKLHADDITKFDVIEFTKSDTYIIAGSYNSKVYIWDINTKQEIRQFNAGWMKPPLGIVNDSLIYRDKYNKN